LYTCELFVSICRSCTECVTTYNKYDNFKRKFKSIDYYASRGKLYLRREIYEIIQRLWQRIILTVIVFLFYLFYDGTMTELIIYIAPDIRLANDPVVTHLFFNCWFTCKLM